MSSKQEAPKQTPTLQVRVWFGGEIIATAAIKGGLSAMKGAK
jgi:hypothetical protein